MKDVLIVKGARTHNLKNVTVEMPRNKMIVFTGLSGSGKSSLAFDTIFAEGQRRYVESLSSYARQFLRQMQKPDVDEITGLSPAISIDQKSRSNNPRSTVATITEIYDYLRVLFARVGRAHCLVCGREIRRQSNEEILKTIGEIATAAFSSAEEKKVLGVSISSAKIKIFAPLVVGRKGEYYQLLYDLLGKGYTTVKIDGAEKKLREQIILAKNKKHDIDVLVDEFFLTELNAPARPNELGHSGGDKTPTDADITRTKNGGQTKVKLTSSGIRERLSEAVERALHESNGLVRIETPAESRLLSAKFMCPYDGFSYPEIEPRLFSFNSPYGACPECNGLGTRHFFGDEVCPKCRGARLREEALHVLLGSGGSSSFFPKGGGILMTEDFLNPSPSRTRVLPSEKGEYPSARRLATPFRKGRTSLPLADSGTPFTKGESRGGLNIVELTTLSIADCREFFRKLKLTATEREIAKVVLKEIESRLDFMINVGIEYLSLDRRAHTLSGGEAQRIRLASQLGSGLVGALYVLDEPTIGLHARDNDRLIKTLLHLRDIGNTILVVEHDEDTIFSSDYIVDLGPRAGVHGGEIVVSGYLEKLLTAKKNDTKSLTLAYLRGEDKIPVPEKRRESEKGSLKIRGANIFNIKNMSVDLPLGRLVVVTGVSGSGKSSFVYEILHKNLQARLERRYRSNETFNCGSFTGSEYISRTILIDQSAIGRTPRSNPATYTGAFTFIRDLFAGSEEARVRGWKANRFSFNVKGGRCEACQGNGEIAVEMHFLPTVYVPCEVCGGKRFMKETLEAKYGKTRPNDRKSSSGRAGKNIYDVLHMTIEEALAFFEDIPAVADRLKSLDDVGLGYLQLGQSATTLSGGEAQRVKISSELYRSHLQKTIYLLDEPTVGLHYEDVRKLIEILQKLVDKGNTVVVIEHNMDFVKSADYIIDIGPEGGEGGGKIVAKGTPEQVAEMKNSYTGEYLKKALRK